VIRFHQDRYRVKSEERGARESRETRNRLAVHKLNLADIARCQRQKEKVDYRLIAPPAKNRDGLVMKWHVRPPGWQKRPALMLDTPAYGETRKFVVPPTHVVVGCF
jgi:hypothetical protein